MKLLLLQLLVCLYALVPGQWPDWEETGVDACGPVLIKLGMKADSTMSGMYELKIDGTPDPECVIVVRSYFMDVAGKKVSDQVTLNQASQWQVKQELKTDSLIGFMHSEIVSAATCSCSRNTGTSNTANAGNTDNTEASAIAPVQSSGSDVAAEWAELPPAFAQEMADTTATAMQDTVPAHRTGPATVENSVAGNASGTASYFSGQLPGLQQSGAGTGDIWSPDSADVWADAPRPEQESLPVLAPQPAEPATTLSGSWSAAIALWGFVNDASVGSSALALLEGKKSELKVLSAAELDSIRIYNDPFILEGLHTIANAYVEIEADKATRSYAATLRQELDLLEEKQEIFMEKYTKLVKTGSYSLSYCNACFGKPIIHRSDGYPPFEACRECKGGGYQLTYHGNAKKETIEHLYFAELLPAPDYRKPTLKRIQENPADFEYDNGVFKTETAQLSAINKPFFFVCMYYKGHGNKPNRMIISEIINKRNNMQFAGADKAEILAFLGPQLPQDVSATPDDMYIWEFNTYEDAYNRSIIPLHKGGVVGFEVDVLKYE